MPPSGGGRSATSSDVTGHLGFPVSTTHVISGAIMGAGASRRFSAVRWGIAGRILMAWVVTIPAAAGVGALCYGITRLSAGGFILAALTLVFSALAAQRWRRSCQTPVSANPYAPPA
ncbi:MAG: inorganic phosphate transporter [Gaiellaceae bacterium]